MKRTILALVGVSALAALPVSATAGDPGAQPNDLHTTNRRPADSASKSARASALIGTEVRNYQDEKLGKVEELAVDLESGRILQVILSSGGFAGIGGALHSVPPMALHHDPVTKVIRLDATTEKLKASPEFEDSRWGESFADQNITRSAEYFGPTQTSNARQTERLQTTGDAIKGSASSMPSSRTAQVRKASKVLGMTVNNLQSDNLGDVNDLLVNLTTGRIVAVVISSGGVLGIGDELTAVPPAALRFTPDAEKLQLNVTKEALAKAPHFPASQWPDIDQPTYTAQLAESFVGEPNAWPAAPEQPDNTARNVRDRDDKSLTPLDQGNGEADVSISARIRKEIMASDRLSMNGKNVKIITRDAHVTLRGPTNSAEEKRLIGEIAARIAGAGNVDNQLEVKISAAASQ